MAGSALFSTAAFAAEAGQVSPTDATHHIWLWAIVAVMLGVMTGGAEIVSRYRDEPLKALTDLNGLTYTAVNGLVALLAYGLIVRYPGQIISSSDGLAVAMTAGFGGMLVLRSRLFILKGDNGQETAIGPSFVIEVLLRMLDRSIDRERARNRHRLVFETALKLRDYDSTADFLIGSMPAFQNLSQPEKTEFSKLIDSYRGLDWTDPLKIAAVCFDFLNLAGEETFKSMLAFLQSNVDAIGTQTGQSVSQPPSSSSGS